jgi:hypothetical protein
VAAIGSPTLRHDGRLGTQHSGEDHVVLVSQHIASVDRQQRLEREQACLKGQEKASLRTAVWPSRDERVI